MKATGRSVRAFAFAAAVSLCATFSGQGATYYLKSGMTDLSVAGSYTLDEAGNTPATTPPGSADEVVVPSGTFAISGSSASFTTLSGVKRVRPKDGAVLEFTIEPDDTRTFEAPINWNADSFIYYTEASIRCYGKVVKKGGGTLILASSGNTKFGSTYQDYFTSFDLQAGTLKMPQHALGAMYYGDVTMAEGTKLVTTGDIDDASKATFTSLRSLNGYGIVTNETKRSGGQVCAVYGRNVVYTSEFHGRLCYPVKHWLPGRFKQYGDSVGFTSAVVVENNLGHLHDGYDRGCYEFENVALLGPSDILEPYGSGAGYHYFGGADGTIAKNVTLYTATYPTFFDAGWHGGLTLSGNWQVMADKLDLAVSKWLVLMGSNAVPCTISGGFSEANWAGKDYASPDGVPYTIFVEKLGSGAWRFAGNRGHGGGFAIKEGSLQFESIAEKGIASSLGRSTNLTTACSVRNVSPYRVNYAFSLGTTNATAATAAFEFVGSKSGASSTRPLVLVGNGGAIRASGTETARLGFGDVSALASGETTLVIDGTNTLFNTISGVKDGAGRVSVVKDGSGEWYLSCSNTFTGDLAVNAGTLTVLGPKYTWYRFTVKRIGNETLYNLKFRQLALYDANGIRQNICLKVATPPASGASTGGAAFYPDSDSVGLAPGSFAFGSKTFRVKYETDSYVDQLFSDVGNTVYTTSGVTRFDGETSFGKPFSLYTYNTDSSGTMNIRYDNPNSWVPFVMRLTNGTPEIVSYDLEMWYDSRGTNVCPKIATMEASIDGVNWDLVETNALGEVVAEHDYDFDIPLNHMTSEYGTANRWLSDGTAQVNWSPTKGTTPRPGAGFPIRSRADHLPMPLQNVRSVSVATNATLKTDTEVVIRSLKVDVAGAGTMDGFTFAEDGTLNVIAADVSQSMDLPGTYVNCTGVDNIGRWSLELNGVSSRKFKPVVVNGRISLLIRGLTITVR